MFLAVLQNDLMFSQNCVFSPSLYFEPQAKTEHKGRDFVDGVTFVSLLGSKSGEICVFGIQCHQLNISFGL